ncbi:MAG: hypothetical protein E6R08_10275 [Nevskiaceae bacterium]|nr:MAG: hypothetical protein E6R08_10275 [Nevskiaceae bacterium]
MAHSNDTPGRVAVLNEYHCTHCGHEWEDEWTCACDDECPNCGAVMTPLDSEETGSDPDRIDGGP